MRIYFHNDLDGRCSAAIVYNLYCDNGIFIEVDYKDIIDVNAIQSDEEIIIVDFSFKPDVMEKVLEKTKRVIWIDHHVTAKEYPYIGNVGGLRDFENKSRSGCELTWEYFCGEENVPDVVRLIGDYDKWALKYKPDSFNFYEGLKLENTNPKALIWKNLFDKTFGSQWTQDIIEHGKTAVIYRNNYCNDMCKEYGYEVEFEGHKGFATNIYRFGSQGFGERFSKYDFCISYIYDGKQFIISIYSENIDISAIAKKYGGGGHLNAAGWICEKLPFEPAQ